MWGEPQTIFQQIYIAQEQIMLVVILLAVMLFILLLCINANLKTIIRMLKNTCEEQDKKDNK